MWIVEQSWQGNSVSRWLIAVAILFIAVPVLTRIVTAVLVWQTNATADAKRGSRWLSSIAIAIGSPINALLWLGALWVIHTSVLVIPEWLRLWSHHALYFGLMLGISWLMARLADATVGAYLDRAAERKGGQVDGLLAPLFRGGAQLLAWTAVLVVGLDNAGYKMSAILGGLGLGGLAFALASKELLTDMLGGVTILSNRPFTVGDKIMFKGQWATVISFGLRTTTLQDFSANFKYIVPNSYFTHNEVTNISAHPGSMILMNIRLSLNNTAAKVKQSLSLIEDILKTHTEVRYIWSKLDHFDDYAFTLRIHYDILEFSKRNRVKTEINLAIASAFQSNEIKFAAMPVRAMPAQAETHSFLG